jgi:hypothetical protein
MAQNTSPIFTQTPRLGFGFITSTANPSFDMTSGESASLFTAGPSGSYVTKMRLKPSGSTAASVFRVFLNNGGSTTVAANNILFAELSVPAITAIQTLAQNDFEIPINIAIPVNYALYGTTGTALGGGYDIVTVAGDY